MAVSLINFSDVNNDASSDKAEWRTHFLLISCLADVTFCVVRMQATDKPLATANVVTRATLC